MYVPSDGETLNGILLTKMVTKNFDIVNTLCLCHRGDAPTTSHGTAICRCNLHYARYSKTERHFLQMLNVHDFANFESREIVPRFPYSRIFTPYHLISASWLRGGFNLEFLTDGRTFLSKPTAATF